MKPVRKTNANRSKLASIMAIFFFENVKTLIFFEKEKKMLQKQHREISVSNLSNFVLCFSCFEEYKKLQKLQKGK